MKWLYSGRLNLGKRGCKESPVASRATRSTPGESGEEENAVSGIQICSQNFSKASRLSIEATRPKTLAISIAPIAIGTALADQINWWIFALTLLAGLAIQIGTNFANDYFGYRQGEDTSKRKGPRRLITQGLITPQAMRNATIIAFAIASVVAGYLTYLSGWWIALVYCIAIFSGIWYSWGKYSLSRIGLADLFVFAFFGPVATLITYYLQMHTLSANVWIASIAPGMIPIAILTANNVRDYDEDSQTGKKTLTVRFGQTFGKWKFTFCLIVGITSALLLAVNHAPFFITQLALIPAAIIIKKFWQGHYIQALANTGKTLILYTILFCIGSL